MDPNTIFKDNIKANVFRSAFDELVKPKNMEDNIKILSVNNMTMYNSNEIVIATIKVGIIGKQFLTSCIIDEMLINIK